MATETLVTFLLQAESRPSYVDLYGSWDNFSQAYPMRKDTQKGSGHWLGCHLFKNIICDGNIKDPLAGRDGCLREGGTYWYYYKQEGDIEFHNPFEPFTSSCPLLPGQTVNVLEIPTESISPKTSNSEFKLQRSFTLNPADRRRNPKPPPRKANSLHAKASAGLSTADRLSRQKWFEESTGRLQTAAAHDIVGAFYRSEDGMAEAKPKRRSLKSASDAKEFRSSFDAKDSLVETTADLIKRPSTRHGLSKGRLNVWQSQNPFRHAFGNFSPVSRGNNTEQVTSPIGRPQSWAGCKNKEASIMQLLQGSRSVPGTPRLGITLANKPRTSVDDQVRISESTERPQSSWSFDRSDRNSWQTNIKLFPETPTSTHGSVDYHPHQLPNVTDEDDWGSMFDSLTQDPLLYSSSERSTSSVSGGGIWDNDMSSKQTSIDDNDVHESPLTTYRNSYDYSLRIKELASSSYNESLLQPSAQSWQDKYREQASGEKNSWDPRQVSQETIRPASDQSRNFELSTVTPPLPTRAPPPPPSASVPSMPTRAPPPPPPPPSLPHLSIPDKLKEFDNAFLPNTIINAINTPKSDLSPPPPLRAPPLPPNSATAISDVDDPVGMEDTSTHRRKLDPAISQQLRIAAASIAATSNELASDPSFSAAATAGIAAAVTTTKSPGEMGLISDLGYLGAAIV